MVGRKVAIDGKRRLIGLFRGRRLANLAGGLIFLLIGLREYLAEGGLL